MSNILNFLIYNSILASLLILFIFILRFVFKNNINPKIQYALWIIVVLRLLLPPSLNLNLETKINLPQVLNLDIINSIESYEKIENKENIYQLSVNTNEEDYKETQDSQFITSTRNLTNILFIIWIFVAICILSIFSISNLFFYRKTMKNMVPYRLDNTYDEITEIVGSKPTVPIYLSQDLISPCLIGLFYPKIVLTETVINNAKTAKFAIIHEMIHYIQKDNLFLLLGNLLCILYWFNPLIWLAVEAARNDAELCCDSKVLKKINSNEHLDYCYTLLLIAGKNNLAFASMSAGGKKMKKRIDMMLNPPQKQNITIFVAVISIFFGIIAFTNIKSSAQLLTEFDKIASLSDVYEVYQLLTSIPNPNDNYKFNTTIINNTDEDQSIYSLAQSLSLVYEFSKDHSVAGLNANDVEKINTNALYLFSSIPDLETITISYIDKPANSTIRNKKAPITYIYRKDEIEIESGDLSIIPEIDNSFWQSHGGNNVIIIYGYSEFYSKLGIEEKEFNKSSIGIDDLILKLGPYKNSWKSGEDTIYRFSPNPIYKNWSDFMIITDKFNNLKSHGIILSDLNN